MNKLVFVSDDYDGIAELMADFLRHTTDWETVSMKDGTEVLAEAALRRPDICILDIDMPHIGGIEAARELRRMFPDKQPVLVGMSGRTPTANLRDVFDHVYLKPMNVEELVNTLEPD